MKLSFFILRAAEIRSTRSPEALEGLLETSLRYMSHDETGHSHDW